MLDYCYLVTRIAIMAKTNAERQKTYRDNKQGDKALNLWISQEASLALKRLSVHCKETQKNIIQEMILLADKAIIDSLEKDSYQWQAYFSVNDK